ncbi:biliverdin-producing heme oxygenase [Roseateles cellulosilyticus]|uniref:Biliverdin-producing heme oxygenase n=1 Tax=Pelomonas cellulosilytica TaxID=2906762 RepID=A0ABS8XYT0_9BURK|nr:biliverdin-producing heme oxygenase [Pelomonas sp. P8]MCE4557784.1 biliverdin-producing heme oxygenase [Pelomonas sp. P8]
MTALRAVTRPHHDRIERLLALDAPMALSRYGTVLTGFERFLAAWEPEVREALPARLHGWLGERSRLDFVRHDLEALGRSASNSGAAQTPRCLPACDVAAAFGSLYVIEGSALGGQVITPRLACDLGVGPGRGASYFHGHGERTGAMWREFRLQATTEIGDDPSCHELACRAAVQTFEALIATFECLLP